MVQGVGIEVVVGWGRVGKFYFFAVVMGRLTGVVGVVVVVMGMVMEMEMEMVVEGDGFMNRRKWGMVVDMFRCMDMVMATAMVMGMEMGMGMGVDRVKVVEVIIRGVGMEGRR